MATVQQTISQLLTSYIVPYYPTIVAGTPLSDYINVDTLVFNIPSNPDHLLAAILIEFVAVRSTTQFSYAQTVTAAELKDIVTDINNALAVMKTAIDAVKTPLAAYLGTLP